MLERKELRWNPQNSVVPGPRISATQRIVKPVKLTLPRNDRLSCSVSKPGVDGTYHPCQVSFSDGTAMIQKGGANHTFRISNDSYARRYSRTKFLATSKTSSPLPHNLWNRQSQKVSCRYTLTSIHLDIYILPRGSCLLVVRPGCMRGSRSLRRRALPWFPDDSYGEAMACGFERPDSAGRRPSTAPYRKAEPRPKLSI